MTVQGRAELLGMRPVGCIQSARCVDMQLPKTYRTLQFQMHAVAQHDKGGDAVLVCKDSHTQSS
jgi:hypothetical protein